MTKLVFAGLLVALLRPALMLAQSEFDGTWKIDLKRITPPAEPETLVLKNNVYQCKTCVPKIDVKADGTDQKVSGNPYYDTISIKVLNDRAMAETEKKDGKTVATSTMTVSPDGDTATCEFTDSGETSGDPVVGKATMTRVSKAKHLSAGSNAISGSWRTSKIDSLSDNALLFTFKVEGNSLTMSNPMGQSYTAKLDGTDAPYKGNPGINTVSVERLSKYTLLETDKRDGRVVKTKRLMLDTSGDGKTMNLIVADTLRGTSTLLVATRQ